MIEALTTDRPVCDDPDCDRTLPADPALVFETSAGRRCAYECSCGAVTVTVARSESTP